MHLNPWVWVLAIVGLLLVVFWGRLRRSGHAAPSAFVCSSCMKTYPLGEVHVLPWWNRDAQMITTSYRCPGCFADSLRDTREAIDVLDEARRRSFVDFLRNHHLDALAHQVAGDDDATARRVLHELLTRIERGELQLQM